MERDKQIEEMVKDLHSAYAINKLYTEDVAESLYEAGYRKASEVAREIFEEIVALMNEVYSSVQYGCYLYGMTKHTDSPSAQRQCGKLEGVKYLGDKIAELKKKYTEGEE